jgi:hypothetical protein
MGELLSYEGADIQNQSRQFALDQSRQEVGREESSRAAMQTASAEVAALDPEDPDYAKRRMEILNRYPEALYSRAAGQFLGLSSDVANEPTRKRERQFELDAGDKRTADSETRRQRQEDDQFARQLALKSGRRDFYDKWRSGYDSAKTSEDRRKLTDELGWDHQQWGVEQSLAATGAPDVEQFKEPVPGDATGKKYYGRKAQLYLAAASQRLSPAQSTSARNRLFALIDDAREKGDTERETFYQQQLESLPTGSAPAAGAASGFSPKTMGPPAASKAGGKF